MVTRVELRIRSPRAPDGIFRKQVGVATSKREVERLKRVRGRLQRIAARGEWDVLQAWADGEVTAEELHRLIDQHGIDNYRAHLPVLRSAPEDPGVPDAPPLDRHADTYLRQIKKKGTRGTYEKYMRKLCEYRVKGSRLGDRPWWDIPRHTIRDAKDSVDLAQNTVRTMLGAWSGFFTWAIAREESEAEHEGRKPLLESNPVRRAKVWERIQTTRHRFLLLPEFERLIAAAAAPMKAQYAALALCGFRIEEFMVLPPVHVMLPTHIHVGPWGDWRPKNDRGIRDVPIHKTMLLPLLEQYQERWAGEETFFTNPNSWEPWSYSTFCTRMERDIEAMGLRYGAWTGTGKARKLIADGLTPHSLRHTLASWLAQEDVQLMKIAAILGDTEETVRQHYAHLLPCDLDHAIQRIGNG